MLLTAQQLYKKYDQLEVLKGVSMGVLQGEMVSIVGPSGAGKSTLLHLLGTLDVPDAGTITLQGHTLTAKRAKLSTVRNTLMGFVFQFHHLLPEFTALENVSIPGWIAKRDRKTVEAEAAVLLKKLGLGSRLQHKPQQLSGGEQQRVAVARALINKPIIVYADEPTGNLDAANANELHQILVDLKHELNQTFVIVTHNEQLAHRSDRIIQMKQGEIVN